LNKMQEGIIKVTTQFSDGSPWKEGFTEDIHLYKKHGRHDIEVESANNEEQFANQFFNFMRKHSYIVISQVSIPQIILEIGTASPRVVPTLLPITKSTMWMTSMNPPLAHYSMSKEGR
jgi:hypothetical protein